MPNIKSAKKRVDVNEKNRAINKAYKSELATALKKYNAAVEGGDVEAVKAILPQTISLVDESVTRGIIHKNKADRKKADINAKFNTLAKTETVKVEVKEEKVEEVAQEEVKPAKKTTTRKTTAKKAEEASEEKPVKKTTRKTATK